MQFDLAQLLGRAQEASQKKTDAAETVIISTVALVKMFKHCSRGVPIEVMGLCIGRFVDAYTVYVQDVFTMPQVGASDHVESIDDAYQVKMIDQLEKVGIKEKVVGWFHSHPGYHCWLSGVDQNMQKSFEKDNVRCVAIVIDPINSANGRLVIESFRLMPGTTPGMGLSLSKPIETRVVTSDVGFLRKKDPVSVAHGMGSQFYQMCIQFNKLGFEQIMINKIQSKLWIDFVGGQKRDNSLATLLERVKERDLIGSEEEASRIIQNAI